jgi:hypothetical protein
MEMMTNLGKQWRPGYGFGATVSSAAVGGLTIFAIGGFVGYMLGAKAYLLALQAPQQVGVVRLSPVPPAVADPAAGWETYTDLRHGYRIKYPSELAAYVMADADTLIIDFPGPSDTPLLRIDVYETKLDPRKWWDEMGRERYPWLFNPALNPIEPSDTEQYGELAGLKGFEVVAQRRSSGGATLPMSALLLRQGDHLFVVIDDTDRLASDPQAADWRRILATFSFVHAGGGR